MNDEVNESWFDRIRNLADALETAVRNTHEAKAELKKTIAQTKLRALAEGHKTAVSQEIYADNTDVVFQASGRLRQSTLEKNANDITHSEGQKSYC